VRPGDPPRERQPESGARRLGRDERFEQALAHARRHAGPPVVERDNDSTPRLGIRGTVGRRVANRRVAGRRVVLASGFDANREAAPPSMASRALRTRLANDRCSSSASAATTGPSPSQARSTRTPASASASRSSSSARSTTRPIGTMRRTGRWFVAKSTSRSTTADRRSTSTSARSTQRRRASCGSSWSQSSSRFAETDNNGLRTSWAIAAIASGALHTKSDSAAPVGRRTACAAA